MMDPGSDSSEGEQELSTRADAPLAMEAGVGLKPQMDSIFAELEKSLPTIDFDLSDDMSSDLEEPMIFHRNLKMSELDYDDEKDLDTSLSGESAKDLFKSPPGMIHIPSVDKNNASVSTSPTLSFDNDLAALLAAREGGPDDGDRVSSWKDLERIALRDKHRQKEKEAATSPLSFSDTQTDRPNDTQTNRPNDTQTNRPNDTQTNRPNSSDSDTQTIIQTDSNTTNDTTATGSFLSTDTFSQPVGILEAGNLVLAQLAENLRGGSSMFGGRTVDMDTAGSRTNTATSTNAARGMTNKPSTGQHGSSKVGVSARDSARERGDVDSNKEVERILSSAVRSGERQRQEQRRKEKDLALSYMSSKAPHLSTHILDSIDWDSPTLDDDVETTNWTPPPSVRAHLPPRAASSPTQAEGAGGDGDKKSSPEADNLTLIQKLARFSLQQSGKDCDARNIDPQTGASIGIMTSPTPSSAATTTMISMSTTSGKMSEAKPTSSATSSDAVSVSSNAAKPSGSAKDCPTNTTISSPAAPSAAQKAMLETLDKRKAEPETVYLDLRGFVRHQEEEKHNMATVSRVLGLSTSPQRSEWKEESSDSEDENKWMKQRQHIKQYLTSRGTSTPSLKHQRLQPARVIQMQNRTPPKSTSSRGVSTTSCGTSAMLAPTPGPAGTESQRSMQSARAEGDSNRAQEAEQAALSARETEKERQKEAARLAREEKEKIRSAGLRMLHHLQGLRSTAAISENKACAENTPVLFDLEASYEQRPPVLPTCMDQEEVLLITIRFSANGEITLHNARSSKTSTETVINAIPKSYVYLICWLVSLIPPDFSQLQQWLRKPEEGAAHYPPDFPPFHVIGLQQLLVEGALCLAVAVCPSPMYMLHKDDRRDRLLKKGKKGEEISRFYRFVDTFISRSSLSSVEAWPRYLGNYLASEEDLSEYKSCLTFGNPYLPFLGKPMSAYMQLHKEPGAVDKIFNKDVGFFWQTVDPQDNVYQHSWSQTGQENVPQNSLFLLSKQALFRPQVVYETLLRVVSQSLDISGLRVLYPSSEKTQPPSRPSGPSLPRQSQEGVTPVLAVAVRGPHARVRLISIVGPTDYTLATKTDPTSLMALYGRPEGGLQIFCPRNAERAQSELVRWFGGRVAEDQASLDVGLPYRMVEEDLCGGGGGGDGGAGSLLSPSSSSSPATGKGRRGRKGSAASGVTDSTLEFKPSRPPAALTATTLGHVVLVLSPIMPIWILGFLVSLMQQKAAFQPRGLRRLCLSVKKANTLGIPSAVHSIFCPGVNLDVADIDSGEHQQDSCSPCTVLILERENASHHASSLAHILATELKNDNMLEVIEDRTETRFDPLHLFHMADYTDALLSSLGGHFSKCPNFDPMCDVKGPLPPVSSNQELEQVVVLILLGKDLIKDWGSFLQEVQSVSAPGWRLSDMELLGVKWLSGMNSFQTREVTPYEIGDPRWRTSVRFLAKEPAVVLALRSVDAFRKLEPFVSLPVHTPTTTIPPSTTAVAFTSQLPPRADAPHPTRLMSRNPKDSYLLLRLFFWAHELYADPDSRPLLPCLPESSLYYHTLPASESGSVEGSKPRTVLKSIETQDLTQENIPQLLLCDPTPLTTFLLIKPRAFRKHLPKILRRVLHEGFCLVGLRLEVMDEDTARRFLAVELENGSQVFDLHLKYLTREASLLVALWRLNGVKKLRDLLGPEDPLQARRQSQFYWRGIYGSDLIHNALYASRTYLESVWDLRTFFPDGLCCDPTYPLDMEQIPCPAVDSVADMQHSRTRHATRRTSQHTDTDDTSSVSDTEKKVHHLLMQTTCLVLPPSLVVSGEGGMDAPFVDIITLLLGRGFELVGARMLWLTQQQAEQFLHLIHLGSFDMVCQMTSAPCIVLALERDNAVLAFENTLGSSSESQSVLSRYGKDILRPTDLKQAHQLLSFFFDCLTPGSDLDIVPLPQPAPSPRPH